MNIRRLRRADAATYRVLMLEGYERHRDAFTATAAERAGLPLSWWEARLVERPDADECVIGAWEAGRLVGVAGLRFERRPKTRHKAFVYGMYVQAAVARRGIGRHLVGAVLDAAHERDGVRVVQLTVTEGNRAAEALYRRCGFVPFGVEPLAISTDAGHAAKVHMWLDLDAVPRHASTGLEDAITHA